MTDRTTTVARAAETIRPRFSHCGYPLSKKGGDGAIVIARHCFQKLFREIPFVSKDHPASNEVTAWELLLTDQPDVASRNVSVVDEVCNAVYGGAQPSNGHTSK
jgi:hypothetical protein